MTDSTSDQAHPDGNPGVVARYQPSSVTEHATDTGNINRAVRLSRKTIPTGYVVDQDAFIAWNWYGKRGEGDLKHDVGWWEIDVGEVHAMSLTLSVIDDIRAEAEKAQTRGDGDEATMWERWAIATESLPARRRIVNGLKTHPVVTVPMDQLDANPYHLVTLSGTVLLDEYTFDSEAKCDALKVVNCSPFHLNTRCAPTRVVWDARSKFLDDYRKTFLPNDEVWAYTLEALSDCLPGGNANKDLPVILGPHDSGKSTLIELLRQTLGTGYVKSTPQSIYRGNASDKPRPDVIDVLRARIAYTIEASEEWELHADQIKRLTGNVDALKVRGMASDHFIERSPDFTPIIVGNEMFRVRGVDAATRTRIRPLHFGVTVPKTAAGERAQRELIASQEAREALLAALLRARAEKLVRGEPLPEPAVLMARRAEVYEEMSNEQQFIQAMEELGKLRRVDPEKTSANQFVLRGTVHELYTRWAKTQSIHPIGPKKFMQTLRDDCGWEPIDSGGKRWRGWSAGELDLSIGPDLGL